MTGTYDVMRYAFLYVHAHILSFRQCFSVTTVFRRGLCIWGRDARWEKTFHCKSCLHVTFPALFISWDACLWTKRSGMILFLVWRVSSWSALALFAWLCYCCCCHGRAVSLGSLFFFCEEPPARSHFLSPSLLISSILAGCT